MNKSTIVLTIVLSLILITVTCIVALNWSAIKTMINGGKLYTIEDINTAYEEGKQDYDKINETYNELLVELQKKSLEIKALSNQITELQSEKDQLEISNNDYIEQINSLTEQIQSMTQQINEMQNKITYYEKIIEGYDFENTLVVTFMYDDTVYDVVLCAIGETVTVDTPTDTDYIKFKGWTVDGTTPIDLASYEINENTTISAILEYYQKVTYMVDDKEVYSKFVLKDSVLELIKYVPQKEYYEFVKWQINGNDITNYIVSDDTIINAVFRQIQIVTTVNDMTFNRYVNKSGGFVYYTAYEFDINANFSSTISGTIKYERTDYSNVEETEFMIDLVQGNSCGITINGFSEIGVYNEPPITIEITSNGNNNYHITIKSAKYLSTTGAYSDATEQYLLVPTFENLSGKYLLLDSIIFNI